MLNLRHRVTIQAPQRAQSDFGGATVTWSDLATNVRAEVIAQDSAEGVEAGASQSRQAYQVRIRWRADVTHACRLVYRGEVLAITAGPRDPDERGRRRYMVMTAVAGVAS